MILWFFLPYLQILTTHLIIYNQKFFKRIRNNLTNQNNNRDTLELPFKGINKPEIKVVKRGTKIYMKVTHDQGFKSVEFSINGKDYSYNEETPSYDPETTELEYYFNIQEGENTVTITATSLEDENAVETYTGVYNYIPEE